MFPVLADSEIQINSLNHRRLVADLQRTQLVRVSPSTVAMTISENLPTRHGARAWARAVGDMLVRRRRRTATERLEGIRQPSV